MAAFQNVVGTPLTPQFAEFLLRGEVIQSAGVRSVVQVWHLKQRPPFVYTPEADLGLAVYNVMAADMANCLSLEYTALDWRLRYMDDPTALQIPGANTIVGLRTGDRLPTFNAVTLQIRTSARGRNYKGSKHFAPVAESDTTLDKLTVAAAGRWDDPAKAIKAFVRWCHTGECYFFYDCLT